MNFQDAFNIAFAEEEKRQKRQNFQFAVTPATAKTLAFMWNMLKAAKNVLDDFVFIDDNNRIMSVGEIKPPKPEKTPDDETQAEKSQKTAEKKQAVNVDKKKQ